MVMRSGYSRALVLAGLLASQPGLAAAEEAFDADYQNVSLQDLMVNLPEADLDKLATRVLAQTPAESRPEQLTPSAAERAPAQAQAVPVTPVRRASPSSLNINEVVLSRAEWLADIQRQVEAALAQNNWPLAELRLAQALAEYPDAHASRLQLAALLYGRGALEQTRAVLQQGIDLAPAQADFRLALARMLAEQERFTAAWQLLNASSPTLAAHLDYYSLKADVARRSGQCQHAMDTYRQLLAHTQAGAWWLGLGLCQRQLGEDFRPSFLQAQASTDLGQASQRFVEQQLAAGEQDG